MMHVIGKRTTLLLLLGLLALQPALRAQREVAGATKTKLALQRLNVLGTVLMIAAHPDDENTTLLAYLARGRHLRTAYLSLTRGEGGQNLIGPELGDLMGVIRTQELLAARRIDGAEQYFTRAIDFGYSKTAGETLAKWGREETLGDIVWVIRKLRPDVVVLRFSGTPRDGHGHHQSSAILGEEAFTAAADPNRFPEQLQWVRPWQARRLMWNVFSFRRGRFSNAGDMSERVDIDTGEYNPLLGFSYAEIAGMSRSQHRSQGFGAPEPKGPQRNSLVTIAGDKAASDPLEGVDTSWNRVPGGAAVGEILAQAKEVFDEQAPDETIRLLLRARPLIAAIGDPWAAIKLKELDETIALATGLWMEAIAGRHSVSPGGELSVNTMALNRSSFPLELVSVALDGTEVAGVNEGLSYNQPVTRELMWKVPLSAEATQPYWLRNSKRGARYDISDPAQVGEPDTPPEMMARFLVRAGDQEIEYERPVVYRWVDRVRGELTRPLAVTPVVAVRFMAPSLVFPSSAPHAVSVEIAPNEPDAVGRLRLDLPDGWTSDPETREFRLSEGRPQVLSFEVTPPADGSQGVAEAVAVVDGTEIRSGTRVIDYEHIPPQTLSPPARLKLVRTDARVHARTVGYVMGAGDDVPAALRQLGCEVTLLDAEELARGDLSRFDAIVTGIRAYNVRADLRASQPRLMDYVNKGGTLIVQYNVLARRLPPGESDPLGNIGPYPISFSSGRVSVEEAPMKLLRRDHPVLLSPNRITERDFDNWVQERGLYFADEWDKKYEPLWEANDPNEKPLQGGTLYATYGEGVYIFTGLSWFRQLPAGVPGAYRIFANFLSVGKTDR